MGRRSIALAFCLVLLRGPAGLAMPAAEEPRDRPETSDPAPDQEGGTPRPDRDDDPVDPSVPDWMSESTWEVLTGSSNPLPLASCALPGPNDEPNMCGLRFRFEHEVDEWMSTGCSCETDCGFYGTCCPDVEPVCGGRDGTQWIQSTETPQHVSSARNARHDRFVVVDDGSSAAPLTRVRLIDIDTQGEHSSCRVERNPSGYWSVVAETDFDDNKATCEAIGLRWPEGVLDLSREREIAAGDGTSAQATLPDHPASNSVPFLQWVRMEDIDGGDRTSCEIVEAGNRWKLRASSEGDSNAWCAARSIRLPPASGAKLARDCPADWSSTGFDTSCSAGRFRVKAPSPFAEVSRSMFSEANHACFLTGFAASDHNDAHEPADCRVERREGRWWLTSVGLGPGTTVCEARCARLHADVAGPEMGGWPPLPNKVVVDLSLSQYSSFGYGSWGIGRLAPGGRDLLVDDTLRSQLQLYQSGEYDMPIVFFEGFDPINRNSGPHHLRLLGPIMRTMLALGFDVWFVELFDGGQEVREIARSNARAIQVAYEHEGWNLANPGREIVAVGVSMGALTGRFLLASWEDGLYRFGLEKVPGIHSSRPPVSLFAAVNGPQLGGNIPLSMQMALQDMARVFDLGEPAEALNSMAAGQMLNARISPSCRNTVIEGCTIKDVPVLIEDRTRIFGQHVFRSSLLGHPPPCNGPGSCLFRQCLPYPPSGEMACGFDFSSVCPVDNRNLHDSFYGDVNRRGPNRNGYPATVTTLGITSGSFSPQALGRLPKGFPCSDWDPYCMVHDPLTEETPIAELFFQLQGVTFLNLCDRETLISAHATAADLVPGDLSGRSLADVGFPDTLPKQVTLLGVRQHFPFMHIPSESALHCPRADSHDECARRSRFDFVASSDSLFDSQNLDRNNAHDALFDDHALQLMAWLADGYFGDADGYCDEANPFASSLEGLRQAHGLDSHVGCFGPPDPYPSDPSNGERETNLPPQIDPIPDQTFSTGSYGCFEIRVSDPEGDDVTLSVSGLPSAVSMEVETAPICQPRILPEGAPILYFTTQQPPRAVLEWQPTEELDLGEYELTITARDERGKESSIDVLLVVE